MIIPKYGFALKLMLGGGATTITTAIPVFENRHFAFAAL